MQLFTILEELVRCAQSSFKKSGLTTLPLYPAEQSYWILQGSCFLLALTYLLYLFSNSLQIKQNH